MAVFKSAYDSHLDFEGHKTAYQEAGNVWKSAYSDIGNTYQAVLTQDSGWHARGTGSDIGDPMTDGVSQEPGGTFGRDIGGDMGAMRHHGVKVLYHQDMYKANNPASPDNQSPDSGYGPGKSDPGMDRG